MDSDTQRKVTVGGDIPYMVPKGIYGSAKVSVFITEPVPDGVNREDVIQEAYKLQKKLLPMWAKEMESIVNSKETVEGGMYTKEQMETAVEKARVDADEKYQDLIKRAKDKIEELTNINKQ